MKRLPTETNRLACILSLVLIGPAEGEEYYGGLFDELLGMVRS